MLSQLLQEHRLFVVACVRSDWLSDATYRAIDANVIKVWRDMQRRTLAIEGM